MPDRVWGIRREGSNGGACVWYGYWRSRHDALGYLTREAAGIGTPGELASVHVDWCTVEPIEWVGGRDVDLRVKRRLYPTAKASRPNRGGADG